MEKVSGDVAGESDGRVARGVRTRQRIVAAHAALLVEGSLRPTAGEVAARAGVSVRALWLNFRDFEGLWTATTAHWQQADAALAQVVDPALPLDERLEAYVHQRAVRNEHLAPARRSSVLAEPFSAALGRSRRVFVDRILTEVAATFAPELQRAGSRRADLHDSLGVVVGIRTWLVLRDDLGHDPQRAEHVVRSMATSSLSDPRFTPN